MELGTALQIRPYPTKDGLRIWVSRREQQLLLDTVGDDPRRRIVLHLGLHGLRTDEIVDVESRYVQKLGAPVGTGTVHDDIAGCVLVVPRSKICKHELPISARLEQRIRQLKSGNRELHEDETADVSKRSFHSWIAYAREVLIDVDTTAAPEVGIHDLCRNCTTDTYCLVALAGFRSPSSS